MFMRYLVFLLISVSCAHQVTKKPIDKYERKHWPHWSDVDRNCRNTRQEILLSRSLIPAKLNKKGCKVVSGKWDDFYSPETHTLAKNVDIDHVVPLKYAHDNGGADWSKKQKEIFANDPENLVITYKVFNRQKGAKGIDKWLPRNKQYACRYIESWLAIKKKYSLSVGPEEKNTIKQIGCSK